MIKKTTDVWVAWAIRNKRSIFFFQNKVIDLTDFAVLHPGGRKSLQSYVYKDITQTLFKVYPHNKEATLQRLMKYVIGKLEVELAIHPQENLSLNRDKGTKQTQKKKVCFQKKGTSKSLENVQSKQSVGKEKENIRTKGKGLTKKSTQLSTSRGKTTKKDRFEVSIKLIEGQEEVDQKVKVSKKKQKAKQNWFQVQVDKDEMQENKSMIVLRVFEVKSKLSL